MTKLFAGFFMACAMAGSVYAQSDGMVSGREIADAWIAAYEAQDYDTMRALLAEDSRFIDPTSFERPEVTDTIDWTGPDAIIAGISAWGMARGEYTVTRAYEASNRVVFNADMRVTYDTANGEVSYVYPITTIVTVDGDHIAEHRDYTDFDGARLAD